MEQTSVDLQVQEWWFRLEKSCRYQVPYSLGLEYTLDRVVISDKSFVRVISSDAGMIWSALRNDVK